MRNNPSLHGVDFGPLQLSHTLKINLGTWCHRRRQIPRLHQGASSVRAHQREAHPDVSSPSRTTRSPPSHPEGEEKENDWTDELQSGDTSSRSPARGSISPHDAEERDGERPPPALVPLSVGGAREQWGSIPGRYRVVLATSLAFVICNMDKVNISVAIIPMAQDFGWSPTISGLVQSSFFYGYLLSQIPGGLVSSKLGGRTVLPGGVGLWSLSTAAVPVLASTVPGLFISRALVGLGEGVAPSAAIDVVARIIAPEERSRATSFIFAGLHVGSLLGLLIAPAVIQNFGWQAVFYLFGGVGLVWTLWWEHLVSSIGEKEPELASMMSPLDGQHHVKRKEAEEGEEEEEEERQQQVAVPWRGFLRSRPVQALAYTHFCNNWFHYTMLAWLPTYFTDYLSLDLMSAAQVSILPPIAAIAVSAIAGPSADGLISGGVKVAYVRKTAQCAAFLGPAAGLFAACCTESGAATVTLVTLSLGLASFSLAGLYCNHADLSPRYAPVLLGLTNTSGAVPGIIGVAFTGWLFDRTGSWTLALFAPSIFFFLTGTAVFVMFGRADRQDFLTHADRPFAVEKLWEGKFWGRRE